MSGTLTPGAKTAGT